MAMPGFLIIGAAKCGTTALARYLEQHPQVFVSPIKEPNFLAFEDRHPVADKRRQAERATWKLPTGTLEEYQRLFDGAAAGQVIGEASTSYLYWPDAPRLIRKYVPHAKLITVLRNPVERAFSSYLHTRREGEENIEDFGAALDEEPGRREAGYAMRWRYVDAGLYYGQLKRYYDMFDSSQIRVYLYEDFRDNTSGVVKDVLKFLGVDESFDVNTAQRHNVSGLPRNRLFKFLYACVSRPPEPVKAVVRAVLPRKRMLALQHRLRTSIQNRGLARPEFDPRVRQRLIDTFRDDVIKLQDLLGRDLSHWLK